MMESQLKTPCPHCGKNLRISDELLGKSVRCPGCQQRFVARSVQFGSAGSALASQDALETRGAADTDAETRTRAPSTPHRSRIARFEIRKCLGSGAFGAVYLAFDPQLEREVAIKVPQNAVLDSPQSVERFLREAKAAAQLHHPNIIPVFDAGRDQDVYYIASAFIDGVTLAELIRQHPPDFRQSALLVKKLAEALCYAHVTGVVHRDVKPANIMISNSGEPFLMDFGLAQVEEFTEKLTRDGAVLGTPAYMSPEQAKSDQSQVTAASDQYSLGVVLYELLCGRTPFSGSPAVVIFGVLNKVPASPRSLRSQVPRDLETICLKAIDKDPGRRYADAQIFADDLDRWLENRPIVARRVTVVERAWRWCQRNPAIARLSAGMAASLPLGILIGLLVATSLVSTTAAVFLRSANRTLATQGEKTQVSLDAAAQELHAEKKRLATAFLEHGRSLCESDDVEHGLLWMARSLDTLPANPGRIDQVVRTCISAWQPKVRPVKCAVQMNDELICFAVSVDGKSLATGGRDKTARIWNLATGAPIGSPLLHPEAVTAVAIDSLGTTVVTGSQNGTVRFWDALSGKLNQEFVAGDGEVNSLAFAADAKTLTIGFAQKIQQYHLPAGKLETVHPKTAPPAAILAMDPAGKTGLVASEKGTRIWNFRTGQFVGDEFPWRPLARVVSFSPDGGTVALADPSGSMLQLVSTDTGAVLATLRTGAWIAYAAAFSPDGTTIATGDRDASVRLWNAKTGKEIGAPIRYRDWITRLSFSVDGRYLMVGTLNGEAQVRGVHNVDTEDIVIPHPAQVNRIKFKSDGSRFLTCAEDGMVRQWDAAKRTLIGQPMPHGGSVRGIEYSPDGKLILSGGINHVVRLWDAMTGEARNQPINLSGQVYALTFTKDGARFLVALAGDPRVRGGTAEVRNVETGESMGEPLQHAAGVLDVAISRDGQTALTASIDKTARLWNLSTRQTVGEPLQHQGFVLAAAFDPEGKMVFTGSRDGTARLWDARTGEPLRPVLQHPGNVWGIAFSNNGRLTATACDDGGARIWDIESGQLVGRPFKHSARFTGIAFSHDDQSLFTGDRLGVHIWKQPPAVSGSVEQVVLQLQVQTGHKLDDRGSLVFLTADDWQTNCKRLLQAANKTE